MWLTVARKEIKEALRNKIFISLSVIVLSLLLFAVLGGYKTYSNVSSQQEEAREMFNNELAEKDRNPHAAAHFGTWLFKSFTVLSFFDPGVNDYTGTAYRVEAHKQSEMNFAAAKDSDSMLRFGSLTVATVLQLFLPLIIIFFCSSSMSKEYEMGTLKIVYAQGISKRTLLWGKILGNYLLFVVLIVPVLLVIFITAFFDNVVSDCLLFIICYAIYIFVCVSISIVLSDWVRSNGSSLLLQLCLWILFCIIIPKINAGEANLHYPLPSYYTFSKQIDQDFYNGIDKDGTYTQRREKLEYNTLKKYRVDSISQLPVNVDGLLLQDAEDYMSRSYRLRSVPINQQLEEQSKLFRIGAFISPYLCIKQLSRGFAGTDLYHHRNFHYQAAHYRDGFIRTLNMELAKSNHKDGNYFVTPQFLSTMEKFKYKRPSITEVIGHLFTLEISVLYWLGIVFLLVEISIIKIRK